MTTPESGAAPPPARRRSRGRAALVMTGKIALLLVGAWLVVDVVRQVNWAQVGDALGRLTWIEILVLALLVAVRQFVNAMTLPVVVPGLSVPHALSTALSGTLIQTFTPPPADAVLRLSMLRSYGVEPTRGAAALVLDTIIFYLARFVAPLIGLLLAFIVIPVLPVVIWMAVLGVAAAAVLVWSLAMISRGETAANKLGRFAGGVVRRLRPSVDPAAWADAMVRFQRESSAGLFGKVGRATPIMLGFIAVDSLVLTASLRFVGIPGVHVSYLAVFAALFSLYPLTIFPFAGLGVLDATLIVLINAEGVVDSPDLIAAMVIWRSATLALPLLPGLVTLTTWRAGQSKTDPAASQA